MKRKIIQTSYCGYLLMEGGMSTGKQAMKVYTERIVKLFSAKVKV
ncbi:MAG: hypothetical protein QM594_03340 [Niabella sp.]